MSKKSFWKGFGAGVLFTTVILGISCLIRTSDANVVAQAKKLGMEFAGENGTELADNVKKDNTASAEPTAKATAGKENTKATKVPMTTENPKQIPTPEPEQETSNPKKTKTPKKSNGKTSMDDEKKKMENDIKKSAKQLEIKAGDWSTTVSAKLEKLGIIDSAKEFDLYLNQHGYGESISAGTYSVSPGDSFQDIAKKITK